MRTPRQATHGVRASTSGRHSCCVRPPGCVPLTTRPPTAPRLWLSSVIGVVRSYGCTALCLSCERVGSWWEPSACPENRPSHPHTPVVPSSKAPRAGVTSYPTHHSLSFTTIHASQPATMDCFVVKAAPAPRAAPKLKGSERVKPRYRQVTVRTARTLVHACQRCAACRRSCAFDQLIYNHSSSAGGAPCAVHPASALSSPTCRSSSLTRSCPVVWLASPSLGPARCAASAPVRPSAVRSQGGGTCCGNAFGTAAALSFLGLQAWLPGSDSGN